MKAVICDRYGAPESLRLVELPDPEAGPDEILIRVACSTVNRTDTATLRAHPFFARAMTGWLRPRHRVTGMDFAGVVAAVGARVTRFAEGDRVFGMTSESFGAHAELLVMPQSGAVAQIPDGISTDAAVICEGAWYASSTTAPLRGGQSILVYGATGAIGTAAVQLARASGAEVTAVTGTGDVALARDLGAAHVLDYQTQDFTKIDARFDVVFDAVGKTSYFACRKLLKPGGKFRATDLGPWWSNIWLGLWFSLTGAHRVSVPFPEDGPGFPAMLAGLMQAGHIRGVFDRRYRLEEIVAAFEFVETGTKTGIVRVDIGDIG